MKRINFNHAPPPGVPQPYDGKPPVGKLTAAHKRFIKLSAETDVVVAKLLAKVAAAREKLVANCTHPADFIVEYTWEWDNGYGKQAMQPGLRCTICDARCTWPNSSTLWTRSEDLCRD